MTTAYDAAIPYDSNIGYDGNLPVVTPDELPTFMLHAVTKAGVGPLPLPYANIDQMSFEDSAPGAIGFTIAQDSKNASLCDDYTIVSLTMNGQDVQDGRWLLRGRGWNAGERGQVKTFTGKSLLWDRLERTVIQPGRSYKYQRKSSGFILNDLFTEAQNRNVGYWDNFTWTFTSSVDSNGQAWPSVIDIEYLPTAKYDDIVANLVDKGLIEIHLLGDEIQVYVQGSGTVVRDALLVVGKDIGTAPQQSTAEGIVSDVVVLGDDGIAVTRSDTNTRAAYWREEGGISQGGTKDLTTLSLFGDVALSGGGMPRVQRTYELSISQDRPYLPIRDYIVGDWIRAQHGDESVLAARVKQLVLKQSGKSWGGSLVLNDKFLEAEVRLTKKVQGIIGGATITGSAQTSTSDDLKDTGIPAPMTGLILSTDVYEDNDGNSRSLVVANWDEVTHNTDGTVATDMGTYYLNWWYTDMPDNSRIQIAVDHPQTNYVIGNLDPGREVAVYVYSKDNSGHQGSWTGTKTIATQRDTIPPSKPAAPLAASILRTLVIEFSGLTATGAAMEADYDHVEVWTSNINDFDPDSVGDFHGSIRGFGQMYVPAYQYLPGTIVYVKFIAVDKSGNRSVPSNQWWGFVQGIIGPDLAANTITANQLAVGSVTAQAIAAGAITAEKISVGQTPNLCPDPSFNNADWRARRLTTEWATRPEKWFFRNTGGFERNGYWLQALSTAAGENGGRMYITDWISTMLGESYYVGMYMITGINLPNPEATMTLGVEITNSDGSVESDGIAYAPIQGFWTKYGYRFVIRNENWVKVRFFLRANNLTSGDIGIDDVEVRGGVGTTATAGSRGLLDALGLFAWNSDEEQTFILDFRTGDFTAKGTIQSGFSGKRTVINPGSTYLPEIRFYPESGDLYAYINSSNSGTFPFIGVNAPDTGAASQAMVLYDNGFRLGEIDKNVGNIAGAAIEGQGAGFAAYLALHGRLRIASNGTETFSSDRWNTGNGPAAPTLTLAMTKPPTPVSGLWYLLYSIQRSGTGQRIVHHISNNSSTVSNVLIQTLIEPPATTQANLTNVALYINWLYIRSDGTP